MLTVTPSASFRANWRYTQQHRATPSDTRCDPVEPQRHAGGVPGSSQTQPGLRGVRGPAAGEPQPGGEVRVPGAAHQPTRAGVPSGAHQEAPQPGVSPTPHVRAGLSSSILIKPGLIIDPERVGIAQ